MTFRERRMLGKQRKNLSSYDFRGKLGAYIQSKSRVKKVA
jgi:hypothetical protein